MLTPTLSNVFLYTDLSSRLCTAVSCCLSFSVYLWRSQVIDEMRESDTTRACSIYLRGVAFKRLHVSVFLHLRHHQVVSSSSRKLYNTHNTTSKIQSSHLAVFSLPKCMFSQSFVIVLCIIFVRKVSQLWTQTDLHCVFVLGDKVKLLYEVILVSQLILFIILRIYYPLQHVSANLASFR